jgi:uncharacterized protein YdhG (YjbR/CyaY superfamily)
MPPAKKPKKPAFTAEERAAMKEAAKEAKRATVEADLLEKIAEMPGADRVMAERLHAIVKDVAPQLVARTWYGMPAYANEDGKVVCFFQAASKFKARYATLGFNDAAALDDGAMWPTSFALASLGDDEAGRIADLVRRAVG